MADGLAAIEDGAAAHERFGARPGSKGRAPFLGAPVLRDSLRGCPCAGEAGVARAQAIGALTAETGGSGSSRDAGSGG